MIIRYFIKKLLFIKSKDSPVDEKALLEKEEALQAIEKKLSTDIHTNLKNFSDKLKNCSDFRTHEFSFGPSNSIKGAIFHIDGMVDFSTIIDSVLQPLATWKSKEYSDKQLSSLTITPEIKTKILSDALWSPDVKEADNIATLVDAVLIGDTILLVDGLATAYILGTKGWEKRAIIEPQTESVVRGPREGFIESYKTNTSLIRRKIKNEKLKIEEIIVGRKTKTNVAILYIDGVADPTVLKKVRYRIGALKVDSILESGYIEQYIEDAPFSPFATIGYTEKPDVVAGKLLEGRVAIVVDGTPFVLTVPYLFIEAFQTSEDYYNRAMYASFARLLRIFGYFAAVFGPSLYIALTTFHQELIPTTLLFTIANARAGTPFPAFIEALIMVFAFELLREAGIRLPRAVGQAVSIVGALIMGESAVQAGIVGAPMVIVVAATAVSGFMIPNHNDSISVIRLLMMALAAFAGFYGLAIGFLFVLTHLASLSSFGVPYLDYTTKYPMQDVFTRPPLWSMHKRPDDIARGDLTRREFFVPPKRPSGDKSVGVKEANGKTKHFKE